MKRLFTRGRALRLLAVAVVAIAAAGAAQLVLAQIPDDRQLPVEDPYRGMTDEEKAAAQAANTEGYMLRYRQWMEEFRATDTDLRSLERLPLDAGRHVEPRNDLAEATADADLIVEAVVDSITSEVYHMFPLSTLVVRVESISKGDDISVGDPVTVKVAGGPFPRTNKFDPHDAVLLYDEAVPLLFPGERAVLFLQSEPDGRQVMSGEYTAQNFTGVYRIIDDKVQSIEGNPFADEVDNLTVDSLLNQVDASR